MRLDDANADGLVKPGDSEYIKIKGTDIKLGLSAVNNTNEMTELKNCIVSGDGISANMSSKNVFYSGGLKVGMPYTEFIELYGEPDYIDNEDYYRYYEEVYSKSGTMASVPIFSATGYECWVKINMDEACVGAFNIYLGNHNKDYEENFVKLGDNGYYWNAPGDFAFDNTMLIEADGNKYLLDASHKFRARSTQKEYFPDALTEEALTNWYTSKDAELKCCKVNDDGTAYVIRLKNNDYYEGYYHSEDNLAEIRFWLYNTDKDNNEEIPQAAKDEAYKLLEEIFSKGITFETAAE